MAMTRRSFIKIAAGTVGVGALGSGLTNNLWGLTPDVVHDPATDGDQVIPTFCEICFWKCGVLGHVKDGRLTKIVGNPEHPLSRGRLCPRGTGGVGLVYDPDRLKTPLIRVKKRGEDVFEAVSWDKALDEVAEKLMAIKEKYGPEALALFSHGYGGSWFKTLVKAYGTGNITAPSYAQCRGAREVGFELTFGAPVGSPEVLDIPNSRVLTLIGAHLGENMHNTQVQDFADAIGNGCELIVVDPRYSTAAGKARYWLPIKPGTDTALILAWIHVILKEKLYDRDFVDQWTVGFDALARHVEAFTPEWAFVRTTIEPRVIVETARLIASARPASLVHPGRRTAWYGSDTQRSRAIAILNALLGNWGRPGGFYIPTAMKVPGLEHPPYAHKPRTPADMPKGEVFPFAGEVLSHGLRDASIPGTSEYDIKAWMVYGTNLIQALPDRKKTERALEALDFMVAIDVLPAEICGWADVVLPEATYLERYDDLANPPYRTPFVALRQPVVEPLYESKPGWWIAKELGERMGLGEFFDFEDAETYLAERTAKAGLDLGALKAHGVIVGGDEPIYTDQGLGLSFNTPSGKVELYSEQLKAAGLPPLPDYTAPEEPPPGQLRLLFGRAPTHTFGRTTNNRFLGEILHENVVWLNAKWAAEQGLKGGEEVRLVNQDGVSAGPVKVKATQRIRPDCAYLVHGFGHDSKGLSFARGRGASDADLMSRTQIDPAMGGTGMNVNFIRVERV